MEFITDCYACNGVGARHAATCRSAHVRITSCVDHMHIIARTATVRDAVKVCSALEAERNDGWAVGAWDENRIVADAEGPAIDYPDSEYERQERMGDAR